MTGTELVRTGPIGQHPALSSEDRPDDPDSTTLITYAMTVAAQVRWQNRLMAQTRWQWLRFIGTGHLVRFSFLILIGRSCPFRPKAADVDGWSWGLAGSRGRMAAGLFGFSLPFR
jgi:hypothetical protein